MKVKTILIPTLLVFVLCVSCSWSNYEDIKGPQTSECDTVPVSFAADILPIFVTHCSDSTNGDCHQVNQMNTNKPVLVDYGSISLKVDQQRIQARLFDQAPSMMPPSNTLGPKAVDDCNKTLIQRWIAAGYPDN